MSKELALYEPQSLAELKDFTNLVTATQLVPQAYRNKPTDAMVAIMYGRETAGLGPLVSLQSVAVINGKPAFFGDALPGIAFNKRLIIDMEESFEGTPYEESFAAVCVVTRPSGSKVTQRFSVADAKKASLWGKQGPWSQFPKRMLQWRARSWAIRDAAPHLLFGPTVEELTEQPVQGFDRARDITPRSVAAPIVDPAESVEVTDQHGQVEYLDPLAVPAWAEARAQESSDDELLELLALNEHAAVRDAVEAERTKRDAAAFADKAPKQSAEPRTLMLYGADGSEAGTYLSAGDWLSGLEIAAGALPMSGALIEANWKLLTQIANASKVPADLRARAAALRERVSSQEAA